MWNCGGKKSGLARLHVPFHREHSKIICWIDFHAILYWGQCVWPIISLSSAAFNLFFLICLHSCCACHCCIYGWDSPFVYYFSVTVILEVGKTHWNILWISIGNILVYHFNKIKWQLFMYMELDLWIFSDPSIWRIQLIWLNVLILRTIWNWHTDLDADYLQRV